MDNKKDDFLYMIWKDPNSRRNYIIGKLSKGSEYSFEYCGDYKEAQEAGWEFLTAFPEDKKYVSKSFFAAFASRLPSPKRRGIESILAKYGLDAFDEYEMLRKSTGRLPIDTYEFVDPILPEDKTVEQEFFVVGIRHNATCEGLVCDASPEVVAGDELTLELEPNNPSDEHAVKVLTSHGEMLGYIPRYYSESISTRLHHGDTYCCKAIEVDHTHGCENCLKVRLTIPRERVS